MKSEFPQGRYTPFGYIDNRHHAWVLNKAGVFRANEKKLGFDWKFPDRGADNYSWDLAIAAELGNRVLLSRDDFRKEGIEAVSEYHSSNLMSYDWQTDGLSFSYRFLQVTEHSLGTLVEISNSGKDEKLIKIHAFASYTLGRVPWWGRDGVTGSYLPQDDVLTMKCFAYGTVIMIGSDHKSTSHGVIETEEQFLKSIQGVAKPLESAYVLYPRPLHGFLTYELKIAPGSKSEIWICLAKGVNGDVASKELAIALKAARKSMARKLKDDDAFWSRCPRLVGDWPQWWKNGWVYDFETQRMNSRPPIGIYKHPWDAMQIQIPRSVLAETSIDALTLSYADEELAKEEFIGVFADAIAPNVPCAREDGSVNMIAADGSECGTGPQWCFPFHSIHSVYQRIGDKKWLAKLYPYLRSYLEWWLKHRTDEDGWIVFKCSWESGQDASKRFLIEQKTGGETTEFVRTVDGQASMAESCRIIELYARWLGLGRKEEQRWQSLAREYSERTRKMFDGNWFRDMHRDTGQPIIIKDYYDIMMLSPIMCGVATSEQTRLMKPMFKHFVEDAQFWTEWASFFYQFCETVWNAGDRLFLADAIQKVADRVYRHWDSRQLRPKLSMPGVSAEVWSLDGGGGSEGYGWGATMPTQIIRGIIGFRELFDTEEPAFVIAPSMHGSFMASGKRYGIERLHFRGLDLNLWYEVLGDDRLSVSIIYASRKPVSLTLISAGKEEIKTRKVKRGSVTTQISNSDLIKVRVG